MTSLAISRPAARPIARTLRSTSNSNPRKARLIKLIHVARRDLQLDEDAYRAILQQVTGKTSSADLTLTALEAVLQHLKRCGFEIRKTKNARPELPMDTSDMGRKIRALWLYLHGLGAVRDASEYALSRYCKRQTGSDALQWLNARQARNLIEALKKWVARVERGAMRGVTT